MKDPGHQVYKIKAHKIPGDEDVEIDFDLASYVKLFSTKIKEILKAMDKGKTERVDKLNFNAIAMENTYFSIAEVVEEYKEDVRKML